MCLRSSEALRVVNGKRPARKIPTQFHLHHTTVCKPCSNAAFEFANNILEVAAFVHLVGRDSGRIRLSWETHYPGDVRSIHSHLLETYLLKSQDAMAEVRALGAT